MNLDDAVNNALNDLELVENERFIDLMAVIFFKLDTVSNDDNDQMSDAVGQFVPSGYTL